MPAELSLVAMFETPRPFAEAIAFSHDGNILASGSEDGAVFIWGIFDGRPPPRFQYGRYGCFFAQGTYQMYKKQRLTNELLLSLRQNTLRLFLSLRPAVEQSSQDSHTFHYPVPVFCNTWPFYSFTAVA